MILRSRSIICYKHGGSAPGQTAVSWYEPYSVPLVEGSSRALSAVGHVLDLGHAGAGHAKHLVGIDLVSEGPQQE